MNSINNRRLLKSMIQCGAIEKSANCLQKSTGPNKSYDIGANTSPISDVECVDEATDD